MIYYNRKRIYTSNPGVWPRLCTEKDSSTWRHNLNAAFQAGCGKVENRVYHFAQSSTAATDDVLPLPSKNFCVLFLNIQNAMLNKMDASIVWTDYFWAFWRRGLTLKRLQYRLNNVLISASDIVGTAASSYEYFKEGNA